MSARLYARGLIRLVLDDGTFTAWDTPVDTAGIDPAYAEQLAKAHARSGVDEAVVTGAGSIRGYEVAVIVGEFAFLGGSIGRATARRIVAAVTRATRERLPLLVATSSGGTRMQEGTPAFVEMVAISTAVVAHKAAGLAYLVYLRHPTTGGVFASWGSLGHVTIAEPRALIGFLGPRMFEALHGTAAPHRPRRARGPDSDGDSPCSAPGAAEDDHVGVGAAHPAGGPAGSPRASRPRRRRRPAPERNRGRGTRRRAVPRSDLVRRTPVRARRAGPPQPVSPPLDGPGRSAGGATGHAARPGARPPAGHGHRHPRRRPLATRRGGRARR